MMTNNKIKIVIGSHGSGKSDWIYNRFINMSKKPDKTIDFDKKLYLIVPEQDTNDRQRIFMKKSLEVERIGGMLNIDVVSFDRIAHIVFDELGIEPARENIVDDDVKIMILSLVLKKLAKEKKLKYCSNLIGRVGFLSKLMQAVSEFYAYNVSDDDIEKVLTNKNSDRYKDKILDLKVIFNEFKNILSDLNFSIKEDKYDLLNKKILKSTMFNDAIVAFDGFTGFTPIQLDIFSKIANVAKEVYVAIDIREAEKIKDLSIDDKIDETDLFYLSKKFIKDIMNVVGAHEIKDLLIKDSILLNNIKYEKSDKCDLLFLEKNLYKIAAEVYEEDIKNIECYESSDIRTEIKNVVMRIQKLIREEKYSYEDIKVMVPNIDIYRDSIIKNFKRYNIPVFIDDSENIINSAYIEAVRSAIDVVNYNFSYDSVMRYLSSGIIPKDENIYKFNSFLFSHTYRGYNRYKYDFENTFENDELGESSLKNIKDNYIMPLIKLYEDMHAPDINIEKLCSAVVSFVESINLHDKMLAFINEIDLHSESNYDLNRVKAVLNLSEEIFYKTIDNIKNLERYSIDHSLNDDDNITIEDFRRLLDIGLSSKSVKSIPFSLDQVVVGDITRTRFENPKVEFFLGLSASLVPKKSLDNNLIDDAVRELFKSSVKELSQTTIETALNQRFYLYLALTNPTEKLILSYSKKSFDNETDEKSEVLSQIENIFKHLALKKVSVDDFEFYNKDDLYSYLANNIENIRKSYIKDKNGNIVYHFDEETDKKIFKAKKIYLYLTKNNMLTSEDQRLLENRFYKFSKNLDSKINENLLQLNANKNVTSATSIEKFNACPYKYFMEETLKLREPRIYKVLPYDIGNIAHRVFQKLFKDISSIDADDVEVNKKVDATIEGAFLEYEVFNQFNNKDSTFFGANKETYIKERIKELIHSTAAVLISLTKSSKNKTAGTEDEFNYDIKVGNGDGIKVRGKIDRIDVCNVDGETYVSVIDYKSGMNEKKFDQKKVENGTDIQLTLYIDYCLNEKYKKKGKGVNDPIFTGTFYFWVDDSFARKDEHIEEAKLHQILNENKGFGGVANSDRKVLETVFDNISINAKKDGSIKDANLSNGYKIADEYISNDDLKNLIDSMHIVVNDTVNKINAGVITAKSVNDTICKYCNYKNVCHKEQMLAEGEEG